MNRLVSAISALIFTTMLQPAFGQELPCGNRKDMTLRLKKIYNESPKSLGITADGLLLEVWSSAKGESWTALLSFPDGMSCLVQHGNMWESVPAWLILKPNA